MANVKNNLGAQRTRTAIERTFFQLAENKPLQKVTVMQIVDACHISRGTFYLHYHDVYELAEKVCDRTLTELETEISRCLDAELDNTDFPLLQILFSYVARHQEQARFLFSSNAPAEARVRSMALVNRFTYEAVSRSFGKIDSCIWKTFGAYVSAGMLGLLENWVAQGCAEDSAIMAKQAGVLITQGVSGLVRDTPQ